MTDGNTQDQTRDTSPFRPDHPRSNVAAAVGERAGDQVGPYKLLELIGEGGFGVVWLAERREPMVQRVAIKIIKVGMDTKAVIARFEQERQALAVMNHPNVASVLDAGALPARMGGRPYFVMEYVAGEPITAYCDRHSLSIRERLELFLAVCAGVQHAHHKGIIHRDLKPGNILVASPDSGGKQTRGTPKVIDFGIAKAVTHTLTERTIFTEQGGMIGTPEYMSPEQAELGRLDIDTRTDVYSLGVVLYELLVGVLPFDSKSLREKGYAEIQRIIREDEVPNPSTRLGTVDADTGTRISRSRAMPRDRLEGELRRELEWIPLKALRKDRSRRYATPAELADDIQRYIQGRPLVAAPESRVYLARKFFSRNQGPVLASALVLLSLAGGLGVALVQRSQAIEQRTEAIRLKGVADASAAAESTARGKADASAAAESTARARAEAINKFVNNALQSSDPASDGSQGITVAQAMANALRQLDAGELELDGDTEIQLRSTIASILTNNGQNEAAAPVFERMLADCRKLHPGDHAVVVGAMSNVGLSKREEGKLDEAEALQADALAMSERLHPGDTALTAECLTRLASVKQARGDSGGAEQLHSRALSMYRRVLKPNDVLVAESLNNLGLVRHSLGRLPEAEALYVEAYEIFHKHYHGDSPVLAVALNNVGSIRKELGNLKDAEPMLQEALEMRRRMFKGDHAQIALGLSNLAGLKQQLGKSIEAEPLLDDALEMRKRLFKGDHSEIATGMVNLAAVKRALGKLPEAEALGRSALDMLQRLYPGDHPLVAQTMSSLATIREAMGQLSEAEPMFAKAVEMYQRLFKGDHLLVMTGIGSLASVHLKLDRMPQADAEATESVAMGERLFPKGHPKRALSLSTLALVRFHQKSVDEARMLIAQAEEMVLKSEPPEGRNAKLVLEAKRAIEGK